MVSSCYRWWVCKIPTHVERDPQKRPTYLKNDSTKKLVYIQGVVLGVDEGSVLSEGRGGVIPVGGVYLRLGGGVGWPSSGSWGEGVKEWVQEEEKEEEEDNEEDEDDELDDELAPKLQEKGMIEEQEEEEREGSAQGGEEEEDDAFGGGKESTSLPSLAGEILQKGYRV